MTEWARNRFYVSGSEKDIRAFKKEVRGKDKEGKICSVLAFDSLYPTPSDRQLKRLYTERMKMSRRREQWYFDNWGTSCTDDLSLKRASPTSLLYYFLTPWCPPSEWVVAVSRKFPKLRFSLQYWEGVLTTRSIEHFRKGNKKVYRESELLKNDGSMYV